MIAGICLIFIVIIVLVVFLIRRMIRRIKVRKGKEIQNKYTADKKAVALAVNRLQSDSFYLR